MPKKDLKNSCMQQKSCEKCPFDKIKFLCKCAMIFNEFNCHSLEYVIKKLKKGIESLEKELEENK